MEIRADILDVHCLDQNVLIRNILAVKRDFQVLCGVLGYAVSDLFPGMSNLFSGGFQVGELVLRVQLGHEATEHPNAEGLDKDCGGRANGSGDVESYFAAVVPAGDDLLQG